MNKFIDEIKNNGVVVEIGWINKNTFGVYYTEEETIHINIHLLVAELVTHELLHHFHPDKDEETIRQMTVRAVNRMTIKEIIELTNVTLGSA